jgi:hypothetical protein
MPLTLSLLTEDDIPAFAVVDDAAMRDWPFAIAMGRNLRVPRIQMVEGWVRHGFGTDSAQVYLQVSDDETGEMVAGALWRFEDGEGREKQDENVADEKDGESGNVMMEGEDEEAARTAAAFADARKSMWKEFEAGFFPGQAYSSELRFLLSFLFGSSTPACSMTFLHAKANITATLISHDTRHDPRPSPSRSCFAVDRMGNPTCRRTWPQVRTHGFGGWARSISEARFQSCSGGGDGSETFWRGGYGVETLDDQRAGSEVAVYGTRYLWSFG